MNMKNIWIVNYYTAPPEYVTHERHLRFAHFLQEAGYKVTIFSTGYWASQDIDFITNGRKYQLVDYGEYHFCHIKSARYKGNGIKRMFSIFQFACRLFLYRRRFEKPDAILHNIHPPFDYPIVKLAKKLKCKYIAEAWDLWPDNFVRYGLVKAGNPAMKIAYAIEKRYYYAADDIIFTLLGAFDYLKRHGWMKDQGGKIDPAHLHYINNGIDLDEFDKNKVAHPRKDADMNDQNLIKIVYLGSISKANNVKILIDAAALMQDMPIYRFFIYGNGTYRSELEQYVKDNQIENVVFKETKIPLEECAWVVNQATVNVMNYEKVAGVFGMSSGKLFQYLAAGKPIVCNVDIAYDNVIKDNNLGICGNINTSEEFATAIRSLAEQPQASYKAMCERVREVAKRFDYKVLAAQEIEVIENAFRTN